MFSIWTILLIPCVGLAALPSLAGVYVVCLIVGGGLIFISTVFGGDTDTDFDADVDVDFDVDADFDVDLDAATDVGAAHAHAATSSVSLATWFSISFVVYFLGAFGVVGTTLSYASELGPAVVLAAALAGGIIIGQTAHQVLRYLKRSSGDSAVNTADYVNKDARVTMAIEPPKKGEVAIRLRGRERFVPATTRRPDDRFSVGDRVVVVAVSGGTAEVLSQKEHEFLSPTISGEKL
jgi:membrane protein implicated in regulation of membrane protease activity